MAIASLIIRIGAQDEGIQKALDSLGKQATTVEKELERLGGTPVGREVIKSLEQIQAATKKVEEGHQRMADRALNAARGLELVGGASKLTTSELTDLNRVALKGVDAFRAMGQEAPPALQRMVDETKKATSAGGGFTSFLSTANGLLGAFGIGLSVGALVSFGKDIANAADALTKMHDKTGISVEGLQRMQIAGDDAGVTLESMTSSVNMLQKRLGGDDKSAVAALRDMGISLAEFKALDGAQQMAAISKAVQGMNDPLRVATDLSALFGKSWADQLPVLKRGFQEVEDGATVMSAGTVKALDDAGDAAGRLYRSFKANLGEALADILTLSLSSTRRAASELTAQLSAITKQATAAAPKMAQLAVPGLPADLDKIEQSLTKTATASIKTATAHAKTAESTKKFEAATNTLLPKVRQLESGLFQVPDALQKIGRGYDESRLGPLSEAVGKVEQNARIANFGFAGMTDALRNVGAAAGRTADELNGFSRFDFSGPIEQLQRAQSTFDRLFGALDDVDQILSNIPGRFAEIGAIAARTGKAIMQNLAQGDIWGAVVSGITGVASAFSKLWRNAEKEINPVREQFVQLNGGLVALNAKAARAGVTLNAMLNAKNPEEYKRAIDALNAALEFQDNAMATLDETVKRYGFSIEELGPAMQRQELDKQAQALFKDWEVLNAAGISTIAITGRMAEGINAYVNRAIAMGVEVPSAMKPMLQSMIDQGQLTDAAGNKITNLEDSGITFAQTMSEGFKSVVDEVKKLSEAISRSLGGALAGLPTHKTINVGFNVDPVNLPSFGGSERFFAAKGGLVTAHGIQHFASGGRVLPFLRRGSDTVPAMLTPGEMVLTKDQQAAISVAMSGQSNAAVRSELAGIRSTLSLFLSALPREMARSNREMIQTAGLRR